MLRTVIVEDEYHSREALVNLLHNYCPKLTIVTTADDIETGLKAIASIKPDLVFLDIQLKSGTGFDLLERVGNPEFEIIFTTAYENFAIRAFKFSAIDYLLKPIDPQELKTAVEKVDKKIDREVQTQKLKSLWSFLDSPHKEHKKQTITLSTAEGYEFVEIGQIVYCEASGSYTLFHLKTGKTILVSKNLKEYENILKQFNFFRSHQSFLINISEVEKLVKAEGGYIVMKNGKKVNISSKKKDEFVKIMNGA